MRHKTIAIVIFLTLGGQCQAADSLWDDWLPKLAEKARNWTLRSQADYPFVRDNMAWVYNVPDYYAGDFPNSPVTISRRVDGEKTTYQLCFADTNGAAQGQFWNASSSRFLPPEAKTDREKPCLEELPQGSIFQVSNRVRVCSIRSIQLRQATFSRACLELGKLGVKLVVPLYERPFEARQSVRLCNLPVRQIIGRILEPYHMEAWQSGGRYIVLQKPVLAGMTEEEARIGLYATIQRELKRHGHTKVDLAGMTDQFIDWLALAANRLPPRKEANASWLVSDLSLAAQEEWYNLSKWGKILRQADKLDHIYRTSKGE